MFNCSMLKRVVDGLGVEADGRFAAPALCELHVNYSQQPKLSNILLQHPATSFLSYIHGSEI